MQSDYAASGRVGIGRRANHLPRFYGLGSEQAKPVVLLPIMIHIAIDKGVAMEPIYDAFTNEQLKIGDEPRSIERGDTVRVFELGERWCGTADPVPTIWLEPLRTMPPNAFEGRLSDHNGKHCLIAYTKAPL